MKKLLILCLLCPIISNAQSPHSKFSVGITASPNSSFRKLSPDGQETSQDIAKRRNDEEKPKLGYTAGVAVQYALTKHCSLESGILFSDRGEKDHHVSTQVNIDPVTGTILGPATTINSYRNYHFYYLDIPLKLYYQIPVGPLKVCATTGLSANFLVGGSISAKTEFNGGNKERHSAKSDTENLSKITIGLICGIGASYDLNHDMFVRVQPEYYRGLTSMSGNAPIKQYQYSMGVNIGFFYKL